ncbi:MAG: hypothetical protein ACRD0J_05910 [Acidimicrobiales bacterium]
MDHATLADLRARAPDLSESHHLGGRKWRARIEDIHLDLYVSHLSELGRALRLPVESLLDHQVSIDAYRTVGAEALVVAKAAALLDRAGSLPGRKDAADLRALLGAGAGTWDWSVTAGVAGASRAGRGPALVAEALRHLDDPDLGRAERRALRDRLAPAWAALGQPPDPSPDPPASR